MQLIVFTVYHVMILFYLSSKAGKWKGERPRTRIENSHHNVEHRQNFVKDEVEWLNRKQEKISTDGQEVCVAGKNSKSG